MAAAFDSVEAAEEDEEEEVEPGNPPLLAPANTKSVKFGVFYTLEMISVMMIMIMMHHGSSMVVQSCRSWWMLG